MDKPIQDIVIIGAGGLGRQVKWLIDRINEVQNSWSVQGFYDDADVTLPVGYPPLLGKIHDLRRIDRRLAAVLAIGNSHMRRVVLENIPTDLLDYPSLIDPSAIIANLQKSRKGLLVFASVVIMPELTVGDFVHINQCCSIGHDVRIGDFCTLYPSSVISGNVTIGKECEFGANSCILQNLEIASRVLVGAGAVVTKSIQEEGVAYVGVPANKICKS